MRAHASVRAAPDAVERQRMRRGPRSCGRGRSRVRPCPGELRLPPLGLALEPNALMRACREPLHLISIVPGSLLGEVVPASVVVALAPPAFRSTRPPGRNLWPPEP